MRLPVKLPIQKYLRECLRYFPRTGKLFWKKRPRKHFKSERDFHRWNNRYASEEAFTTVHKNGAKTGAVAGKFYVAHRVIWKLVTGKEPGLMVDHWDRKRGNNRWKNLRRANRYQNGVNRRRGTNNGSGVVGVTFNALENRWKAQINVNGERVNLGSFKRKDLAVSVRLAAEKRYHGDFSPRAR